MIVTGNYLKVKLLNSNLLSSLKVGQFVNVKILNPIPNSEFVLGDLVRS